MAVKARPESTAIDPSNVLICSCGFRNLLLQTKAPSCPGRERSCLVMKVRFWPPKFHSWVENLFLGIDANQKIRAHVKLQQDGGFQNVIVFAERQPLIAPKVWDELLLLKSYDREVNKESGATGSFSAN